MKTHCKECDSLIIRKGRGHKANCPTKQKGDSMKVDIDVSEYTEADEVANRRWHEGYRAFVDKVLQSLNPYAELTDGFINWNEGWIGAEETK